ncbi:hypothetical protein ES703_72733 [subsurface metagenome]
MFFYFKHDLTVLIRPQSPHRFRPGVSLGDKSLAGAGRAGPFDPESNGQFIILGRRQPSTQFAELVPLTVKFQGIAAGNTGDQRGATDHLAVVMMTGGINDIIIGCFVQFPVTHKVRIRDRDIRPYGKAPDVTDKAAPGADLIHTPVVGGISSQRTGKIIRFGDRHSVVANSIGHGSLIRADMHSM